MGQLLMGSAAQTGQANLATEEQGDFISNLLKDLGPQASAAIQEFLQPQGQYQDIFQQAFVDPALQTYEQQVLPAIQQRFIDAGAGSSSALNQALGQSAADLSTMLGGQMGQFYQQQQANKLSALGLGAGVAGQRTFEPIVQQQQGIMGPLIGAAGQIGAASAGAGGMSSLLPLLAV